MIGRRGFGLGVLRQALSVNRRTIAPVSIRCSSLLRIPVSRQFSVCKQLCKEEGNGIQGTKIGSIKVEQPQLMLAFTCKKCDTRSSHSISKQAYTKGTVMVTCPGCQNRHLIADHLKIFSDTKVTIEDIMKAKGESVSQNTDDLVFEDIPEKLKPLIGHYSKDAPEEYKNKLDNETVHQLKSPNSGK